MSSVTTLRPQGNHFSAFARFNDPLDRVEAQRAMWLDYRIRLRELEFDPTLETEIKAVAARAAWHAAWRAANENTDRGVT